MALSLLPCVRRAGMTAASFRLTAVPSIRNYWQLRNVFSESSKDDRMKEVEKEMSRLFDDGGSLVKLCRRNVFSEFSMDDHMNKVVKEMNRLFDDVQQGGSRKLSKILSTVEKVKEIPVICKDGDDRFYKLELDMQEMQPEDINISLKDKKLTISARREDKRSDGSHFMREYKYQYSLPKEVNPDTIRSVLADGVLTIKALLPAIESKEIPVKIENSCSDSDKEAVIH